MQPFWGARSYELVKHQRLLFYSCAEINYVLLTPKAMNRTPILILNSHTLKSYFLQLQQVMVLKATISLKTR